MSSASLNRVFTSSALPLGNFDLDNKDALKLWQNQLAQILNQVQSALTKLNDGVYLSTLLSGSGGGGAGSSSLTDLGSPSGNSIIDTSSATRIAVRVNWTTAANWTLTLNNLAQGATVFLRLANASGASRTFTVLANTPTSTAYAVVLYLYGWSSAVAPVTNTLSSGISVANGTAITAFGMAYTVGGVPTIHMVGSIG